MTLRLARYKLRFHETHVRALPYETMQGTRFEGPGVDLRGHEAEAILSLATPFEAWVLEREPGVVLRSVSVERETMRVLITLAPNDMERPRVVRVDGSLAQDLIRSASELEHALGEACADKLRKRLLAAHSANNNGTAG